jgi:Zn-dependent alcohol dehydrogenase
MKAAVVDAIGAGFKIAEVELARPLGSEVLMDVRASGLCHTDHPSRYHQILNPRTHVLAATQGAASRHDTASLNKLVLRKD